MEPLKDTAESYLAQSTLLRLLGAMSLVIAPHLLRVPPWVSLLAVTIILWRATAARRNWPLPSGKIRLALTLLAFGGVYASFGSPSGLSAGTALLTLMLTLKLTEMRSRRDVIVVVCLCYFMLLTHFLFSQELWTAFYLLACAVAITAVMIESNHGGQPLPMKISLRMGATLVAQALPLMVAFFVLFPRIPGPLWGLPKVQNAARSGLSDSMSPGDIASLIQSDELAFRVRFEGAPPKPADRYWRGPSFERFDGRKWTHLPRDIMGRKSAPASAVLRGRGVRYEITLEPHDQTWMFALGLPDPDTLPPGSYLDLDLLLTAQKPVRERWLYRMTSHLDFVFEPQLDAEMYRLYTRLPPRSNPQAQVFAQQLSATHGGDGLAIAEALMQHFREEKFFYTLQPPILARDSIDDFLFNTRRGFCEHYASSFTYLMRAAGIPARVVTGYQGGELNELGDYFVVRQADAHAWSEFWLPERGWVRADPTAAVAPIRIEQGLAAAIPVGEGLPNYLANRTAMIYALEARIDWIEAGWNRWVLAYGPELQESFLRRFGLINWGDMVLALTALVTLMLGTLGFFTLRQSLPVQSRDEALRLWQQALRTLARSGLQPAPAEGAQDFAARLAQQRPDIRGTLRRMTDAYLRARYLEEDGREALRALAQEVKNLQLARKPA